MPLVVVLVAQLCLTVCNPRDCSLPGSSAHGILQAGILEWVAMPFSRASFQTRDWTWVSFFAGRFFTFWVTREVPFSQLYKYLIHCRYYVYKSFSQKVFCYSVFFVLTLITGKQIYLISIIFLIKVKYCKLGLLV